MERTQNEANVNQINAWEEDGLQVFQAGGNGVRTDIGSDAWGRTKSVIDKSVFDGLFTYDIPIQKWLKFENGTEVATSTRVFSEDWHAVVKSGTVSGNAWFLRSKRHPRYQPNRWHLFSTALFLPSPTATGIRKLGMTNLTYGAYFQLENGILYAVILDGGVEKRKEAVNLGAVWLSASDLQYGHLYDVQFQWRGVGDYFFYIDQKLAHRVSFLGKNVELTIRNPAISVGFQSVNTNGTEVEIRIGCVDVTSEGWQDEGLTYVSVSNLVAKAVNAANYPVISARVTNSISDVPNTRDCLVFRATGSSDQRSYMKAYVTRDATALTGASFSQARPGSSVEFDVSATALDTAKAQFLWSKRIEANASEEVSLPSTFIDFDLVAGDYVIITIERETPTQVANVVASIEMGEEI